MTVHLRPFQLDLERDTYAAWAAGARNVMAVAATGSGKTVFFSKIIRDSAGASCAIAHRQELVSQMSVTLARNGVRHRVIGSATLRRICTRLNIDETGYDHTHPNARCAVAGVDTLVRMDASDPWFKAVSLVVTDEGHHCLTGNKWGAAARMFPNARGLLVTATPMRADGCGLGSHADGIADAMVVAPGMRDLINMGYLTDYRIFAPPSDLDLSAVTVGASGDFSMPKLREATHRSHIVGDVVQSYLKFAGGKLGVTFSVDVESAVEQAQAYRAAGVPAEVVSAKTPDTLRAAILRRFRNRELLQLVNVDLFGEGFDLPAIEVVSMARATQSFSLFSQQFGRALRLMLDPSLQLNWGDFTDSERLAHIARSSKPRAIIIDHVSNVLRHNGPPDRKIIWSLDRREKRSRGTPDDVIPMRVCLNKLDEKTGLPCLQPYERYHVACPFCGFAPVPAGRSSPEMVDGDLQEMDAEVLAALRGDVARVDGAAVLPYSADPSVIGAVKKWHHERQQAQAALREAMAQYGGVHTANGEPLAQAQKRFYLTFGVDVMSAQALGAREAEELRDRITKHFDVSVILF